MSDPWVVDAQGRLVVSQRFGTAARLFGLPFAAVGLYLAWQLLASVVETVLGGVRGDLLQFLVGWPIGAIVAAGFLVPGWMLVALRKRTIVDRARREVTDVKDFLLFRRARTQRFGSAPRVRLVRKPTSNRQGRAISIYSATLIPEGGTDVIVWLADAPEEAREVGRRFATLIDVPVDDLLDAPEPTEDEEEDQDEDMAAAARK